MGKNQIPIPIFEAINWNISLLRFIHLFKPNWQPSMCTIKMEL